MSKADKYPLGPEFQQVLADKDAPEIEKLKATIAHQEAKMADFRARLEIRNAERDVQQRELNKLRPLVEKSYHLFALIEHEAQQRLPSFALLGFVRRFIEDINQVIGTK